MIYEEYLTFESKLLSLQTEFNVLEHCYLDNVIELGWKLHHDQDNTFH